MKYNVFIEAQAVTSESMSVFVATLTEKHGFEWHGLISATTVIYTLVLTATSVMHNWKEWATWIHQRQYDFHRLWNRLKKKMRSCTMHWFSE